MRSAYSTDFPPRFRWYGTRLISSTSRTWSFYGYSFPRPMKRSTISGSRLRYLIETQATTNAARIGKSGTDDLPKIHAPCLGGMSRLRSYVRYFQYSRPPYMLPISSMGDAMTGSD